MFTFWHFGFQNEEAEQTLTNEEDFVAEIADHDIDKEPEPEVTDIADNTLDDITEKTIEIKENEANENEEERVTCVDSPDPGDPAQAGEKQNDDDKEIAPLASMEHDPAPMASIESTTEFQSL